MGLGFGSGQIDVGGSSVLASDAEIVFFEGDDYGDELGEEVRENEAQEYRLEELLPLAHCFFGTVSYKP